MTVTDAVVAVVETTPSTPGASSAVVNRIQSTLPDMSATMARIAEYLLEHPHAPLDLSIGELAEKAGTSAATVTRFCRIIGYAGYAPFRVSVATDLGRADARQSWQTDIGRTFGPDDAPEAVLSTLVNAHTRTLHETAAALDLDELSALADRIAACRHTDIYGVGGSAMLAEEMQARLYRIGLPVHAWSEVHAGLTSAAIQGAGTVAIGISNTGRTDETLEMLAEAGRRGAFTVAVTNNPVSPLAEIADLCITTSVFEQFLQPDDLSAKHGQLFVLDLLYLLVAQRDFPRASEKLAASSLAVSSHRRPPRSPVRRIDRDDESRERETE